MPPEEQASFDCNEMSEPGNIRSQSLHMDDAAKEAHAYEVVRRMDEPQLPLTAPSSMRVLTPEAIETKEQLGEYLAAVLKSPSHHSVAEHLEGEVGSHEQGPVAGRKRDGSSPCDVARGISASASRTKRHTPCA